jgi:ubiquinone/menaquinone biosynthesis C-methylase UbiE
MSMPAIPQQNFPEIYERVLVGPLFTPWAEALLDSVALEAGDSVLDVACGTGIAARLARARLGATAHVVGVDINRQMLAVARAMAPDIGWREGNAVVLPVGAGERFDVVLSHQGLQFFPDRPAALAEMRRVMVPGGRLGVAVWTSLEGAPLIRDLHAIAARHLGEFVDRRHAFGEARELEQAVAAAGFRDVRVTTGARTIRFADGEAFLRLNTMAFVGMSATASEMPDEERVRVTDAIVQESGGVLGAYSDPGGLAFELSAHIATGVNA